MSESKSLPLHHCSSFGNCRKYIEEGKGNFLKTIEAEKGHLLSYQNFERQKISDIFNDQYFLSYSFYKQQMELLINSTLKFLSNILE